MPVKGYTMRQLQYKDQLIFFLTGFFLLVIGMVIEFALAAVLPSSLMGTLFDQGVVLILIILFFAGGVYLLRRGLLGEWRYHYDYIIFMIAGCIFATGSVMTLLNLQVGHPYLELASTNPVLMIFLWVLILPPINPLVTAGFSAVLFGLAGLYLVSPPSLVNKSSKPSLSPKSMKWWRHIGRMVRMDVWLGSLFLVVLAFLILGGPPLSTVPLPLSNGLMWGRLVIALLAAALFNSCVFIINQLGDIDTDRFHQEKSQLPFSAGQLSRRQGGLLALIFLSLGVLCAILVGISYFIVLAAIIVFGVIYSLPPIRLKARPFFDLFIIGVAFGLWAVLAAWAILFFLPEIPLSLIVGASLFYAGTHGIHTASDYAADAAAGVKTTAVLLGPKHTARIGIFLISLGWLLLYTAVGFYTHLFWYGLLKYKSILLLIFSGLPVFALFYRYRNWQKSTDESGQAIQGVQRDARWVTYLLFLIMLVYLTLYVFLFYPTYYPNYSFPWS